MSIGATVATLRKSRGLSLNDMEKLTGINKAALSRYERNLEGLGAEKIDRLCIVFHTTPSVLYAVAKYAVQKPEILNEGEGLCKLMRSLSLLIERYLNAASDTREQVDTLLENRQRV